MLTTITTPSPINTTITDEGSTVVVTTINQPIAISTLIHIGKDGKDGVDASSGNTDWDDILNKPTTFPPDTHTHSQYTLNSSLSTVATSGSYTDLVGKPTLGTASALNVPAGATAASGEVVKGDDTRLSDARTPVAHNHSIANVTGLQTALDGKFTNPTGDTTQYVAGDGSLISFPVTGQAGSLVRQVRNETGAVLTKGTVVYISGASGNKPTVSKGIATSDATSAQTFGIVQADINNNQNGYVIVRGDLDGLDTSAYAEGAQLYLSGSVAGTYTTIKPVAPLHLVYVGVVTRSHNTQGQIEVAIQNGYEIEELHDVLITSKLDNQVIVYEQASNLWKNKTVDKAFIGLGNVDNTSDINKPISSATQTALNNKQPLDGESLKLSSVTSDPAPPTGGILLYSKTYATKHLPKMIGPSGVDTSLQVGLHGNSVFMVGPTAGTAAPTIWGGTLTTSATMSSQQTVASANRWLATYRKRFQTTTTAANMSGMRSAYTQWFLGNQPGFGGFFFRAQFGWNINLNGGQKFIGLCNSTAALAGEPSALLHILGCGWDAANASTGNLYFMHNNGSGVADKVDLGTGAARSLTTHGFELIMFAAPNSAVVNVFIQNLHTGVVLLDTSYTTKIPAVNTGLAFKCEVRNGAIAAADNIECAKVYIESDY